MSEPRSNVRTRPVVAGLTDVGRQRKHNEDHVLLKPEVGLFAVADGMGGHNAGDVASKLTTTSLGNYFDATEQGAPLGELPEEYGPVSDEARRLVMGIRKANLDVHTISNTHQQHHGMGSTIVAVHVTDDEIHICHVGDSRCYRIRDGEIEQLTRDHSLINDALEMKPDLTKEELARLPKNIITRALGMKDVVKVDLRTEPTQIGDIFLLCSDGLSGMVPNNQIAEIIGLTDEAQEACELLISEANEAGGTDNISAVVIRIEEPRDEPLEEPPPTEDAPAIVVAPIEEPAPESTPMLEISAAESLSEPPAEPSHAEPSPAESLPEPPAEPSLAEVVSEDVASILEAGGEVDLDLRGAWTAASVDEIERCARCKHELFPGNLFCVECGSRVEAIAP